MALCSGSAIATEELDEPDPIAIVELRRVVVRVVADELEVPIAADWMISLTGQLVERISLSSRRILTPFDSADSFNPSHAVTW